MAARAQITDNPLPAPLTKGGLAVEVRDVVRLPETRNLRPVDQDVTPTGWARVSFVRDAPDGRRFVNDSRGFLYIIDGGRTSLYADFATAFPFAWYARIESGFIGFDFHPEFLRNGLWYSVHLERADGNPATPDFIPPGYGPSDVTFHNVITEWHANDPRREVHRHAARALARRARRAVLEPSDGRRRVQSDGRPGSADYGLLYTSGSDLGFSNGGGPNANNPSATQRLDSVDHCDPAHRSAQPERNGRREGPRRLHDSGRQQVPGRRRPEDARRDLRVRFPQRAPAVVGPHGRHAVRRRHRHEPYRRGQHRQERRQLRLDEARRLLGERHDSARRRAESALRAARRRAARAGPRRVHLSRRDLRP